MTWIQIVPKHGFQRGEIRWKASRHKEFRGTTLQ